MAKKTKAIVVRRARMPPARVQRQPPARSRNATIRQAGRKKGRVMASTREGAAFLKAAFATPDFENEYCTGIPDNFTGKTVVSRDQVYKPMSVTGAAGSGTDLYVVLLPTPGTAYWTFTANTGAVIGSTAVLNGVAYANWITNFGSSDLLDESNSNFTKYRYIGNQLEIVNTTNDFTWAGSITTWKFPVSQTDSYVTTSAVPTTEYVPTVQGLEGLTNEGNDMCVIPFNKGAYAVSTRSEQDFPFHTVMSSSGTNVVNQNSTGTSQHAFASLLAQPGTGFVGCGTMDAVVMRISVPAGVTNSFVIRTWANIEYLVAPQSNLWRFAKNSPPLDPQALIAYKTLSDVAPIAVPQDQNASFWEMLLRAVGFASRVVSYVPGPIGMIGAGVNAAINGIASLVL
jgi:hypothetical protein